MHLKQDPKWKSKTATVSNFSTVCVFAVVLQSSLAQASVESSLSGIQNKLTHVILPTISIIAIAWAAFSMMSGNERAKMHMWYAILGSIIGFGAQALVDFISQTVR